MSDNSVAPLAMQCDIKFKPKYKIAAVKPEMVINQQAKTRSLISASKTDRNDITTAIPMFSGFRNTTVI